MSMVYMVYGKKPQLNFRATTKGTNMELTCDKHGTQVTIYMYQQDVVENIFALKVFWPFWHGVL